MTNSRARVNSRLNEGSFSPATWGHSAPAAETYSPAPRKKSGGRSTPPYLILKLR